VKRAIAALLLLAFAGIGGALAYQAAVRERDYRALLVRGDTALRDAQTLGAIEAYSGAIALHPDSTVAHLRRGETYRQLGDFDAAARDFRIASDLDPTATRPLEALGDALYRRQWFKHSVDVYERRLRLDERSSEFSYKLALARYRDRNVEGARAALSQAIRLNDQLPDAYYLLGLCLREEGRSPEAVNAFERAVALSPGLVPAREELADVYGALGRRPDQLEQLQVLALLDRTRVERQVAVSLAQGRAGHGELAVLTLSSALERTSDRGRIYGALGRVWLEMADTRDDALSKALEALERVALTADASSEVMTLYGRALVKANKPEVAEQALRQATRRFPVEPGAFVVYADVAERQNHIDAARAALIDYDALVSDGTGFASRAARIGRLSLRLAEPSVAVAWFHRASTASPGDIGVLASLAEAQLSAGDRAAAQRTIASGLEKDPKNAALITLSQQER
jgi:tetratricopeptide (TPR) repeat protein